MEKTLSFAESEKAKFVTKTYAWMGLALLISAISAFITAISIFNGNTLSSFGMFLFGRGMIGFWIFAIAEIILVFWLSASIRKISVGTATLAFILYSVINGVTLSSIFVVYQLASIAVAFVSTSVMFFAMAFYGATTKRNLMSWGKYLMMALVGVIAVSLVEFILHFFVKTTILDFVLSIASIIIFTALTAYDSQKIMKTAEHANGSDDYKKVSILAALELYLDFINIFLNLLRLFGRRNS